VSTSGNRAVDMLITYRLLKLLIVPFEKQDAFKYGIIDKTGKVLKKYSTISRPEEQKSYTWLHRFIFNVKRILGKVGLGGRLGTLAAALGMLLKEGDDVSLRFEDKYGDRLPPLYSKLRPYKKIIESAIVSYCKHEKMWEEILEQDRNLPPIVNTIEEEFIKCPEEKIAGNYFGCDVYYNHRLNSTQCPRDDGLIKTTMVVGEKRRDITYK